MRNQIGDSLTATGDVLGEVLGTTQRAALEDVATQPIDITLWIDSEVETS